MTVLNEWHTINRKPSVNILTERVGLLGDMRVIVVNKHINVAELAWQGVFGSDSGSVMTTTHLFLQQGH